MKTILRKEVKIGLLVILALAILFFGINFLKGINIFKASNYYYAVYTNVEGLAQSAPVTLNGYKIGLVRELRYDYTNPGHVVVELSLDKALRLPAGTEAALSTDLLGTASIVLKPGDAAKGFIAVGDTVKGTQAAGLMTGITENLMPAVNTMIPKIDTLLTSLNAVVSSPALTASMQRLDAITLELEASLRQLHGVMNTLGPISRDIKGITGNVDSITGDLTAVSARLSNVPVDSIMIDLGQTVANLEAITESLRKPDSTIGKLTSDPALYDNLNATVASLDSLFVDIKRNPKRYVTIKVF